MRLKHYQDKVLKELKDYLGSLADAKKEFEEIAELKPHLAKHINFPKEAWEKMQQMLKDETKYNNN
jgi:type III restriction enzyme